MARGRLISKSLGSSRKFHALLHAGGKKLGEFCQVLFPLIVANTDDYGRLPGDAFTVKNVVLPSSMRPERDFDEALDAIASVGLVERYAVNGAIYLQVNQFDDHQPNLHKRQRARFPEFPGSSGNFRGPSGFSGLTQNPELRTQNPEENPEGEPRTAPPARREADALFEQFWSAYPKKKAKDAAQRAWEKRRPNPELLSVILRALERQKCSPDWLKDSGRYIPFPATWLNQARWTDEVDIDLAAPPSAVVSDRTRQNLVAREAVLAKLKRTGTDDD